MNDAQFSSTSDDESPESDNLTGNYVTLTLVPAQRENTTTQTITRNEEKNITWVLIGRGGR